MNVIYVLYTLISFYQENRILVPLNWRLLDYWTFSH